MRKFLLHASLFIALLLATVAGYVWLYREHFPAPRLTRNVSLNEQLKRVKQVVDGDRGGSGTRRVNYLAVGSSMSLNNLNSRAVLEHFGDSSYLNTGAWSTRIHQTALLTPMLMARLHPHTLLLTSNMEDWMHGEDYFKVDTTLIGQYLSGWSHLESYLRLLRPSYYLREMERNKVRMKDPTYFDFLGFDPWGGASINVPPERVEEERNIRTVPRAGQVDLGLYTHLEWLAQYVADQRVRLIFIQSPYRQGVQSVELQGIISAHEDRVRAILEPHGHSFLSATDRIWPDELYIDPSHLKAHGAYMFTQYVLGKLDQSGAEVVGHATVSEGR
jgi:hypothetical protein